MFVRVVRFTGVTPEKAGQVRSRIDDSGVAPPGVPATGVQMLADEEQGTAVVLQFFDSAEDMRAGAEAFSAMDRSETPGERASVDMCELLLDRRL